MSGDINWYTGLTDDEIRNIASKVFPRAIQVIHGPDPSFFTLRMIWDDDNSCDAVIFKTRSMGNVTGQDLDRIREHTEKQILEVAKQYVDSIMNGLIEELRMEGRLRARYADKNILLKVPRYIEERVAPSGTIRRNFGLHYRETSIKNISKFQSLWEYVVFNEAFIKHAERLFEYLYGIELRFEQAHFSLNTISELCNQTPDNDIWWMVNYFLFEFLSTVRTIGDNLACLLDTFYQLKLEPLEINFFGNKFTQMLKVKSIHAASKLTGPDWTSYQRIKTFRDIIQHNHVLHVVQAMGSDGKRTILVPTNPIDGAFGKYTLPPLAHVSDRISVAKLGMKELIVNISPQPQGYLDPVQFCDQILNSICRISNSIFERMELELRRKPIGKITHFYSRLSVAEISFTAPVCLGNRIVVEGETTFFSQIVGSMEIDHVKVEQVSEGQSACIEMEQKARENDVVYIIE